MSDSGVPPPWAAPSGGPSAAKRSDRVLRSIRRVGVLVGLESVVYISALAFGDRHVAQTVLIALVIGLGCFGALLVMFLMARRGRQ